MSYTDKDSFEPLVVLQFSPTTPTITKDWVIKRLTTSHTEDEGSGLLARYEHTPENQDSIIVIGGTLDRLLAGAEEIRIQKWYKNKGLTDFIVADIEHFENSENPSNILYKSEKQRIIYEEIQNLHPARHETTVPGIRKKTFVPENDTILNILTDHDYLVNFFPLHDKEDIKLLEYDWFASRTSMFKSQDIHKIRNYFGENVAYYFAFLEFYTKALVPTAVLGLLLSFLPTSDFFKYSFFCFFNVIWWTVFMERWKRLTNKLAYEWGTLDLQIFERPRSRYFGDLHRSPITDKIERQYPAWKRQVKKYLVSYPIIMGCLIGSLTVYFTFYRTQKKMHAEYPLENPKNPLETKLMRMAPSTCYSLVVIPIKLFYRKLATFLTDYENHRLQTAYENNLTSKLFIFFFVNCFAGLFYEAFFNVNYANVVQLLTTLVIVNAIILKFTEQVVPFILKTFKKSQLKGQSVEKVSEIRQQIKTLTPFEGTYGDYLTIFEQYGYIALFSAVFPWVALCGLINNIFELRADAFKYCYVYQRPFSQPANNIGSWHHAFDILSSIAIVTNTALIAMQPSVREYFSSYSNVEYIIIFVAAEHILLALKFAIDFAIPDVPHEVEIARAKTLYESSQALRREREHKSGRAQSLTTKL
ncbi:unnamed protein product [Adineta steineri]|uniref:Anoctamin n=1 Tax=Adineta steineri TaxID=433720 RepID=A0A819CC86_9BILA|nr:unnamed protein product [Adineta steineri]CAF3818294.1 unnamed protein product [Adineta steineri]